MVGPSVPQPDHRTPVSTAPFHLHVVGWRGVAHSIALVNQWQLLAFAERTDVQLTAADAPLLKKWKPSTGLFNAEQEQRLGLIPALAPDEHVDAELRVFGPSDVTEPSDSRRMLVFAVAEFRGVPMGVRGASSLDVVNPRDRLSMVVPSSCDTRPSSSETWSSRRTAIVFMTLSSRSHRRLASRLGVVANAASSSGVVRVGTCEVPPRCWCGRRSPVGIEWTAAGHR